MRRTAPFAKGLISLLVLLLLNACVNPSGNKLVTPEPTVLIISEYVEGSSFNKALEITNIGESAADLTKYVVEIYFNGSVFPSNPITLDRPGSALKTLAARDSFVLVYSASVAGLHAVCDQESEYMNFNGDDAVVLKYGDSVVDSIGYVGQDPGTEWGLDGATTCNKTLRRKAGISTGDTDIDDPFDPNDEWDYFPTDSFDDLGRYDPSEG